MKKSKGKSICIFSAKGGTGKSITTLNLAGIFSMQNKKVLIIDYDLSFGCIGTYLNKPYKENIYNIIQDYSNNRFENISSYVTKYNDNIYYLASVKDPRQGTKINPSCIENILEKSSFEYDYILIDTDSELSEKNIFLMDIVDSILLIMNNDLANIKNMHNLIKIFNDAEKSNYKILLNESNNLYKNYFSMYDIKKMMGANIDYYIDSKFFIKNIDNYIYDGKIITLDPKFVKSYPKINKVFMAIFNDMEDSNE